ncbi:MAG: hypothetical protein NVS3B20_25380 [Polyangiales bacterium]
MLDNNSNNGASVQLWDCVGSANQQWTLGRDGLLRGLDGKCLEVRGSDRSDGAMVQLWDCRGGLNQKWIARKLSN